METPSHAALIGNARRAEPVAWFVSSSSNRGPNPLGVLWSVVRSLAARRPRPAGKQRILDTASLATVLERLQASGIGGLEAVHSELLAFRDAAQENDPEDLDRDTALAFWLNLYNAGAMDLAVPIIVDTGWGEDWSEAH